MQVAAVTEGSGPNTDALYQVLVAVPASSLGHQWWLLGTSSGADAEDLSLRCASEAGSLALLGTLGAS